MNTQELSKRLGVGLETARQLMASPGFPAIKIKSQWRVTEVAFERWYRLNEGNAVLQPQPVTLPEKRGMRKVWNIDPSVLVWPGKKKEAP